jgi:hypothetical protein
VPTEIFACEFGVVDGYVFSIPYGVFGVEYSIAYFHVAAVLERIISVQTVFIDDNIGAMHEDIIGIGCIHVMEAYTVAMPECLLCVGDSYALK